MNRARKVYMLFICLLLCISLLSACGNAPQEASSAASQPAESNAPSWSEMSPTGQMELLYAKQFSVEYYEGGLSLVTISNGERLLIVPEDGAVPEGLDEDIIVLQKPIENIYLASSSAMDLFRQIGALDSIKMTGTKPAEWTIPEIKEKIDDGSILYGGKYSAPDYEMILEQKCGLAIENTMIYHTPEVKEQLERIGIPVFIERSSYEEHPLGRVEWMRLYGLLCGKEKEAESFMLDCRDRLEEIRTLSGEGGALSVAFFYISTTGSVNVRKPGDYISKMIEMAGGSYLFADLIPEEENALSTVNLQMEDFYKKAVNADILIYNSTVDAELKDMNELLEKSSLLGDFKAVKEGNVWCTRHNMFQETTGAIGMMEDFYKVLHEKDEPLTFLYRLE